MRNCGKPIHPANTKSGETSLKALKAPFPTNSHAECLKILSKISTSLSILFVRLVGCCSCVATRALDDHQLSAIEGTQKLPWKPRRDVQMDGVRKTPHFLYKKPAAKRHMKSSLKECPDFLVRKARGLNLRIRVYLHLEK